MMAEAAKFSVLWEDQTSQEKPAMQITGFDDEQAVRFALDQRDEGMRIVAVFSIEEMFRKVSRAAIVETIFDPSTAATLGSMTFPTFTGDSDAGVLFSFDGFSQADITSISWTVAPSTDELIALNLNALQGDADCPRVGTNCSNSTLNLTETVALEGGDSCFSGVRIGSCMGFESLHPVAFRALGAVPEVSTWAMMLAGFGGLGFAGYRRPRRVSLSAAQSHARALRWLIARR